MVNTGTSKILFAGRYLPVKAVVEKWQFAASSHSSQSTIWTSHYSISHDCLYAAPYLQWWTPQHWSTRSCKQWLLNRDPLFLPLFVAYETRSDPFPASFFSQAISNISPITWWKGVLKSRSYSEDSVPKRFTSLALRLVSAQPAQQQWSVYFQTSDGFTARFEIALAMTPVLSWFSVTECYAARTNEIAMMMMTKLASSILTLTSCKKTKTMNELQRPLWACRCRCLLTMTWQK